MGDLGSIPGSRRSPGEGNGNLLQYSCLENSVDKGAWWVIVHRVTKVGHDWVTNTILVGIKWFFVALICISPISKMLSIFSYAYRHCISSLEKFLLRSFAHFLIGLFVLLLLLLFWPHYMTCSLILGLNPCPQQWKSWVLTSELPGNSLCFYYWIVRVLMFRRDWHVPGGMVIDCMLCLQVACQIYDFHIFSPILWLVFSLSWWHHLQHPSF